MAYQITTAARLVSAPVVCRILTMRQYDPDPAIDARIRRAVRYGQTRWAEIWLSVIMWVVGLTCLMPWPTFVGPQYRIITRRDRRRDCLGGGAALQPDDSCHRPPH
ncbi:hypothetical protein ACLBXO_30430 [Methylobacterium sp. C33D]